MLCGSLAGRGVWRRILSFSILVTSISLASFLFCRVFTLEKGNLKNKPFGLRLRSQDIAAPCPSPFLLISAANGKLPSPDPPLASPTSWKCPGCFTCSAHLRFHFVIHWGGCRQGPASLSHGLHPLGCSIKGRQSQWRSREAETNPETNSSHAEAWILSLQHEGLRCPPVPAAHSSRLQHRGARSARWAPFFPLKPIAPSLGQQSRRVPAFSLSLQDQESPRGIGVSLITQLLLDGAWMRIPAVDLKSSSFQDSGSGNLSPAHVPWLLPAACGDWDTRTGCLWQGISRYYRGQRRRSEIWTPGTQFCRESGYQGNSQPSIHFFLPKGDP